MMSKPAISIFSQLRTPVAQEGAGSEDFLLRKQEFTVLQYRAIGTEKWDVVRQEWSYAVIGRGKLAATATH
jgi:hypothetical protein